MNVLDKHSLCCVNTFHPEGAGPTWVYVHRGSTITSYRGPFFFEYKGFTLLIAQQGSFNSHRPHNGSTMDHLSPTSGI
eukprot:13727090-Heterocapsa_arctica.AAC.1